MDRAPVLQLTQKEICIIRMKHIGALIAQSYDPELVTHVFGCRPEVLASPESKTLAEFVEEELDEGEGVVEKLKGMIDLEGRATIDKFKVMLDAEIQAQVPATTDDDSAGGVGELNEIEKPSTRQVPTTWSIVQSLRKAMATDETPEVYAARRKENRNFSVFISPPGTPRGVRSKRSRYFIHHQPPAYL